MSGNIFRVMLTVVRTFESSVDMPGHDTIIRGGSVRAVNINVGVNINLGIVNINSRFLKNRLNFDIWTHIPGDVDCCADACELS